MGGQGAFEDTCNGSDWKLVPSVSSGQAFSSSVGLQQPNKNLGHGGKEEASQYCLMCLLTGQMMGGMAVLKSGQQYQTEESNQWLHGRAGPENGPCDILSWSVGQLGGAGLVQLIEEEGKQGSPCSLQLHGGR